MLDQRLMWNNVLMSKMLKESSEQGFITLIILMVIIIAIVVGLAYFRVSNAQG